MVIDHQRRNVTPEEGLLTTTGPMEERPYDIAAARQRFEDSNAMLDLRR